MQTQKQTPHKCDVNYMNKSFRTLTSLLDQTYDYLIWLFITKGYLYI